LDAQPKEPVLDRKAVSNQERLPAGQIIPVMPSSLKIGYGAVVNRNSPCRQYLQYCT